jgi:hypothetical protein
MFKRGSLRLVGRHSYAGKYNEIDERTKRSTACVVGRLIRLHYLLCTSLENQKPDAAYKLLSPLGRRRSFSHEFYHQLTVATRFHDDSDVNARVD